MATVLQAKPVQTVSIRLPKLFYVAAWMLIVTMVFVWIGFVLMEVRAIKARKDAEREYQQLIKGEDERIKSLKREYNIKD